MKKKISIIFVVVFFLMTNIVNAVTNYYQDSIKDTSKFEKENIRDYDVEIHVNEDASMNVTEKITVYAKNDQIKHGIYRDFPTQYENKKVRFDVKEVLLDGEDVKYNISSVERGARIRIGDEDTYLRTGLHTYTIKYTTERQITFYDDYDELYWNVIGSGWNFEIEKCHAKIYFPEGTKFISDKLKTYNGRYGSKENNAYVFYDILSYENAVEFNIYETIPIQEAFTVSIFVEKGAITEPDLQQKIMWFLEDNIISVIMIIFLVGLIFWQISCWKKCGKDPKPNVIIPKYYPPDGMTPADVKYVSTMGSTNRVLEASMIDLAVKGYLKFTKKSEKDRKIIIEKNQGNSGLPELDDVEKLIYKKIKDGDVLEYSNSLQQRLSYLKTSTAKTLSEKFQNKLFFINGGKIAKSIISTIIAFIVAIIIGVMVNSFAAESYFMKVLVVLPLSICVGIPIMLVVAILKSNSPKIAKVLLFIIFGIPFIYMIIMAISSALLVWFEDFIIGWMIVAIIADQFIFGKLIVRYSEEGLRIKEDIEGFKMFINTAKDDDFEEKTPEMFDKYFPYAYVLGLENKWANKFENVLKSASYAPSWCSPYMYHNGVFDATSFTTSFSSSFSSGMSSAATAPSSSGGSGGGGFSGGGGGGRRSEEAGRPAMLILH